MVDHSLAFGAPMVLPATTIWQPYASLIAISAKPFETRGYPPPAKHIGKRIAIHAAVRRPPMQMLVDLQDAAIGWAGAAAGRALDAIEVAMRDRLPMGAVVCTAVLMGAYQCGETLYLGDGYEVFEVTKRALGSPASNTYLKVDPLGDYSPGRRAWLLTDVQPLAEPVLAKGKQGWWYWEMPANKGEAA